MIRDVPELGKLLLVMGLVLAIAGALLWLAPQVPWLGRLPGDIRIERSGVRIYLPIVTCIVISVVLTLVLNLIGRWR
jgi:hypothetical protein